MKPVVATVEDDLYGGVGGWFFYHSQCTIHECKSTVEMVHFSDAGWTCVLYWCWCAAFYRGKGQRSHLPGDFTLFFLLLHGEKRVWSYWEEKDVRLQTRPDEQRSLGFHNCPVVPQKGCLICHTMLLLQERIQEESHALKSISLSVMTPYNITFHSLNWITEINQPFDVFLFIKTHP